MQAKSIWVIRWIIFALALFAAGEVAGAADEQVYRFSSSRRMNVQGHDHLVVVAENPKTRHPVRLIIPNTDAVRYDPNPAMSELVKRLEAGVLITAAVTAEDGVATLNSLSVYTPKPGEDSPNGYVFVSSTPKDDTHELLVTLSKFGQTEQVRVAPEAEDHGTPQPDERVAGELHQVKAGDVVWIHLQPGKAPALLEIVPWTEPRQGKLLKVVPAQVEDNNGYAVEIEDAGQTLRCLVPGRMQNKRWVTDQRLLSDARKLRAKSDVLFRVRQAGSATYLLEINPVPQPTAQAQNSRRTSGNGGPAGVPVRGGGRIDLPPVGSVPGGF